MSENPSVAVRRATPADHDLLASVLAESLYLRHGFEDQRALHLPDGGPPMYPMWRRPR